MKTCPYKICTQDFDCLVAENLPVNAEDQVQSLAGGDPHASQQLSPCTTAAEPDAAPAEAPALEPATMKPQRDATRNEKAVHLLKRQPKLAATRKKATQQQGQ